MNRVELRIPNRPQGLAEVKSALDAMVRQCGVPQQAAADMAVALDEVLSNIVSHGYADQDEHAIDVVLQCEPPLLEAQVEDDGLPFDPLAVAPPEPKEDLDAWPLGGLGVHLVRNLMSDVAYARVQDRNRLHMVRRFDE